MVSKCLIVGHAPSELTHLFGYNPVIEIDWEDPASQLQDLLRNMSDHGELIERNYDTIIAEHTWAHRWRAVRAHLGVIG
jgi:hypothetical protein